MRNAEFSFNPEEAPTRRLPDIYRLIESGAPSARLIEQLYSDFYNNNHEAAFLALQEIRKRGHEGEAVLKHLAGASDQLADIVREILDNPGITDLEIEELFNIKRFGTLIDRDDPDSLLLAYQHAKKVGAINPHMTYEQCIRALETHMSLIHMPGMPAGQITGAIEEEVFNLSSTFGSDEPTYFELAGPMELLRLREIGDANFLLLGSYGKYSSRDFKNYAKKIDPRITTHVIDVNPSYAKIIKDDPYTPESVVAGDARELPYASESVDHVYTNFLLGFVRGGRIKDVFTEAQRVLKMGGSFVLMERNYGEFRDDADSRALARQIDSLAARAGFKLEKKLPGSLMYTLAAENGLATVDKNGFAHYDRLFVEQLSEDGAGLNRRFIKI